MGIKDEYERARTYIRDEFSIKKATGQLFVFETTIRFVGGLLILFGLTGEQFYKTKAQGIANALLPAFETPSGIAKSLVNPVTKTSINYNWAQSGSSILAEFGDSFYEYLIKSYLLTNKTDSQAIRMHKEASDAIQKQ
uniref:alpha-1,2-Mannosidase n=1 Tax=Panagrolaimus davidi TaxID=227884 RepID=A0A914QYH2_9BILA